MSIAREINGILKWSALMLTLNSGLVLIVFAIMARDNGCTAKMQTAILYPGVFLAVAGTIGLFLAVVGSIATWIAAKRKKNGIAGPAMASETRPLPKTEQPHTTRPTACRRPDTALR